MIGTLEQHSGKDAKPRRAAGVIIFSFALLILAIVSWHMVSPATAHEISYDDAIKQIANGNVKSARVRVSKSDAEVTLALRNSGDIAKLTIPSSSVADLTSKLNNAGASIVIAENFSHGSFLVLVPLFLILGLWFAVSFWLMKKPKPATPS